MIQELQFVAHCSALSIGLKLIEVRWRGKGLGKKMHVPLKV